MKKRSLLLVAVLSAAMVLGMTACGEKSSGDDLPNDTPTEASAEAEETEAEDKGGAEVIEVNTEAVSYSDENYGIMVTVQVPIGSNYKFIEGAPEDNYYVDDSTRFTLVGDNAMIQFYTDSYVYQTSTAYIDKHGQTTANFADYKAYMTGDEYTGTLENLQSATFGIYDAISADYKLWDDAQGKMVTGGTWYSADMTSVNANAHLVAIVSPVEKGADIDSVLADATIKDIISSVELSTPAEKDTAAAVEAAKVDPSTITASDETLRGYVWTATSSVSDNMPESFALNPDTNYGIGYLGYNSDYTYENGILELKCVIADYTYLVEYEGNHVKLTWSIDGADMGESAVYEATSKYPVE